MRTVKSKRKLRVLEEIQAGCVPYATLSEWHGTWATWNRKDIYPRFEVASSGCLDYGLVLIFVFAIKFSAINIFLFCNQEKKISIVGKDYHHFTGMVRLER